MMPDVAKNRVYLHVLLLIVAGCRRMMVTIGSWYGSSCDLACGFLGQVRCDMPGSPKNYKMAGRRLRPVGLDS
jgi:hypothetical protein